jgi:nanoRNase/pAp phosphatase (c-di-AMP/oligoRNAs hydrolase)
LRVPDSLDFNAGKYLEGFQDQFEGWLGGGHEKAGGFSMDAVHRKEFLSVLKNS